MKKALLIFACSLPFCSFAQSVLWKKTYGGTGLDICNAIKQTTDGGYIQVGRTESNNNDVTGNHGSSDIWLVKTDATGAIVWQKTYGGTSHEDAYAVQQTTDGGYIFAGYTNSADGDVTTNHGTNDVWVVKTDATGTLQWQKTYGGTGQELANSIEKTSDGGYILCGNTASGDGDVTGYFGSGDIWVIKISATGTIEWNKCLGDTHIDQGYKAMQTTDGGYMVAGYSSVNGGQITGNHGGNDYWVVKTDATGTLVWQKSLGGSLEDRAYTMDLTTDGGCVIAGYTVSANGDITTSKGYQDCWIVKVSSTGTMDWQQSIGGSFDEQVFDIKQTSDGGYIVAAASESSDGDLLPFLYNNDNYFILKLSGTGAIQWKKVLGGQMFDVPHAIQATSDGNYIVAGGANSTGDDVTGSHGSYDYWVVKLSPTATGITGTTVSSSIIVYPNPATTTLSIENHYGTAIIYDVVGRIVATQPIEQKATLNIAALEKGTYFIQLLNSQNKITGNTSFTKL